jgi:uncharacterized protein (DUF924 family)
MTSTSPADTASAILHFWFDELSEEQHWRKDPAMDREIAKRFGAVREAVLKSRAKGWRDTPVTLLAAIILLDQFSRNIFRGTARAFDGDALALKLTKLAMERGWVREAPKPWQVFFLMPLMHSEEMADQERCVAEFKRLGGNNLKFAILHHDQIKRFGRFPGRNTAVGRVSSPEEREVIAKGETF